MTRASSTSSQSGERSPGRIAAIVIGSIVAVLALASVALGATAVGVHETQRDADGYYTSSSKTLTTPTHALVTDQLEVGTDPAWLFRKGRLGTVRVAATSTSGRPVFVGIARTAQVESYLGRVSRDTITDFELDPFSVTYDRERGSATPAAPGTKHFWAGRSTGNGRQTLSWPVQKGDWTIVVMNADGSPGIRTDVQVGAKAGFVLTAGIILLIVGAVLALLAALVFWQGGRTPAPTLHGWASSPAGSA
jgi:hypothetical protein